MAKPHAPLSLENAVCRRHGRTVTIAHNRLFGWAVRLFIFALMIPALLLFALLGLLQVPGLAAPLRGLADVTQKLQVLIVVLLLGAGSALVVRIGLWFLRREAPADVVFDGEAGVMRVGRARVVPYDRIRDIAVVVERWHDQPSPEVDRAIAAARVVLEIWAALAGLNTGSGAVPTRYRLRLEAQLVDGRHITLGHTSGDAAGRVEAAATQVSQRVRNAIGLQHAAAPEEPPARPGERCPACQGYEDCVQCQGVGCEDCAQTGICPVCKGSGIAP